MKNIVAKIDKGILTLTIDLSVDLGPSKSGKTMIVATSSGNKTIAPGIKLGVNVFRQG